MRLDLRRERPHELDAGCGQDLGDHDDAELDLTPGHQLGHDVGLGASHFALDVFADAEAIDQSRDMEAAPHILEIGDRPRGQERALERVDGADVRSGRARAYRDADARARDVGPSSGQDPAVFDQPVQGTGPGDHVFVRLARVGAPDERGGQIAGHELACGPSHARIEGRSPQARSRWPVPSRH